MAINSAVSVRYSSINREVNILKEEPSFTDIVGFLEASTVKRVIGRRTITEVNGIEKTVEVTALYPIGNVLCFELENGVSNWNNPLPKSSVL